MICVRCQATVHSLCANTHRRVGEIELIDAVFEEYGAELFVRRDEPATTWCDCDHQDSLTSTQTAEGNVRCDYNGMTYDHVSGTTIGAPR